jgi:hypothetical protein
MVKNACGGNKAKGFARKNMVKGGNALRISECEEEIYVQVTKMLGNSMCNVVSLEGQDYLCHIRGKFSGRGKRDNLIATTTWLLVGLREWERKETIKGKLLNCDVITVYNDNDKIKLKNSVIHINWNSFIATDNKIHGVKETCVDENYDDTVVFMDEKAQEYQDLIESQLKMSSSTKIEENDEEDSDEEINIDDI